MNPEETPFDPQLDQALREIRDPNIDTARMEAAADRVWSKLSAERHDPIRGCEGFRQLFADSRAGRLAPARKLLLQDHLHECVACRKEYDQSPKVVTMPPPSEKRQAPVVRWAMAAAAVLVVGLGAWSARSVFLPSADGSMVVENLNGQLYRVAGDSLLPLKSGESVAAGTEIRTAKQSGAMLRLADGSLVEMRERSSFAVAPTGSDLAIKLAGGSVIVEAAKRSSGHLFVNTRDCRVAVTGTVFSVTSGAKGSRVAVVEGEVRVAQARSEHVLKPGDQYASSQAISPTTVADEIAWSRKVDQHLAMLKEFSALRKELEAINLPGPRYSSRLLRYVPQNTFVYASIPNLADALGQASQILERRASESPVLREWWAQKHDGMNLGEMLEEIRQFSAYLGDEVVVLVAGEMNHAGPIFLAESRKSGLRDFIKSEANKFSSGRADEHMRFAASAAEITDGVKGLQILESGNLIAISPNAAALREIAAKAEGAESTGSSQFLTEIASTYRDGTGLLFAVNLEHLISLKPDGKEVPPGMSQLRTLMVHDTVAGGKPQTHAELTFTGTRTGFASWLAPPGQFVVLDYVSSDATVVSATLLKTPAAILDELFAWLSTNNPKFSQELARIESEIGLRIRDDLAAPLGTQYLFALDGPALPPSWKVVAEVYDAARLQNSIERLVDAGKRVAAQEGKPVPELTKETIGGRVYYKLSVATARLTEAHYVYSDGFLVAAASRQLVDKALQVRSMGGSLTRSQQFQQLLPRDRYASFSAMLYYNFAAASDLLGTVTPGGLSQEQRGMLEKLAGEAKPQLFTFYGEENRITFASSGSLVGVGMDTMLGGSIFAPLERNRGTLRARPSY